MPVATRSMKKATAMQISTIINNSQRLYQVPSILHLNNTIEETNFTNRLKILLRDCELAQGKYDKMRKAVEIFEQINQKFPKILSEKSSKLNTQWSVFAACIYNKTTEFYINFANDCKDVMDKNLTKNHYFEFIKARKFLKAYLKNLKISNPSCIDMTNNHFAKAFKNIDEYENVTRPRRNISPVDYTGMDTIDPECEYDGITDIWVDLTINYDPDYVPEKDENEDEEENEDEMSAVSHSRPKRNIKQINYSEMDMGEEDQGSINICKTKWNNRIPMYYWVKYPASQANEFDDEDYYYDE